MKRATCGLIGAIAIGALAGCEPVSEPWVSGEQAEALEAELTRTSEQSEALRARLQNYGGAYK